MLPKFAYFDNYRIILDATIWSLFISTPKHLVTSFDVLSFSSKLAFVVHCESLSGVWNGLSPGLGCTGTESHIVGHVGPSTSHQARLQIRKWRRPCLIHAMPKTCRVLRKGQSQQKLYFVRWLICNFFKEQFSIISPKKGQWYQHNMLLT